MRFFANGGGGEDVMRLIMEFKLGRETKDLRVVGKGEMRRLAIEEGLYREENRGFWG